MSFAASVESVLKKPGGPCMLGRLLDAADPKWAEDVRAVLANPGTPTAAISRAFALPENGGHIIKTGVIGTHRRGDCCCAQ